MADPTDVIRNAIHELITEVERVRAEKLNVGASELSSFVEQLRSVERALANINVPAVVKANIRLSSLYALRRTHLRGQTRSDTFFILPLLQALVDAGGEGKRKNIKQRVYELVHADLNSADRDMLPGSKDTPRWENRVDWARNKLKAFGYIRNDSPSGTWAITNAGRSYLEQQRQHPE